MEPNKTGTIKRLIYSEKKLRNLGSDEYSELWDYLNTTYGENWWFVEDHAKTIVDVLVETEE